MMRIKFKKTGEEKVLDDKEAEALWARGEVKLLGKTAGGAASPERPRAGDSGLNVRGGTIIPKSVKVFMPKMQQRIVEEGPEFVDIVKSLESIIAAMPKTYENEKIPAAEKIIYLHYFYADSDWYVAEKDIEPEQLQAFGYAILHGDEQMAEWGYVNIEELKATNRVELDFHWKPKKFKDAMRERGTSHSPSPALHESGNPKKIPPMLIEPTANWIAQINADIASANMKTIENELETGVYPFRWEYNDLLLIAHGYTEASPRLVALAKAEVREKSSPHQSGSDHEGESEAVGKHTDGKIAEIWLKKAPTGSLIAGIGWRLEHGYNEKFKPTVDEIMKELERRGVPYKLEETHGGNPGITSSELRVLLESALADEKGLRELYGKIVAELRKSGWETFAKDLEEIAVDEDRHKDKLIFVYHTLYPLYAIPDPPSHSPELIKYLVEAAEEGDITNPAQVGEMIYGVLTKRATERAVDYKENVARWIDNVLADGGVPQFVTRYASKRFPENMVLGRRYGGKGLVKAQWFKNVPLEDAERMERGVGDWRWIKEKYKR